MIKILSFASTRNDKNNLPDNNDDVNYIIKTSNNQSKLKNRQSYICYDLMIYEIFMSVLS